MGGNQMNQWLPMVITIICSVMASSGFWAYVMKYKDSKDVRNEMLIGLGHDRIISLGMIYIERGWVTQEEYENLYEYLYKPYEKMWYNGFEEAILYERACGDIQRNF